MNNHLKLFSDWYSAENMPDYLQQELALIANDEHEIMERFYKNIEFGTGGMRGLLGAGTNRMNIYSIRLVSEALALSIKERGAEAIDRGVIIAYDTRHFSKEFALECAKTIGKYGITIRLFSESRPTPELSFAIRYYDAEAGLMITASHNPAEYNGIKIYGRDGSQLALDPTTALVEKMDAISNVFQITVTTIQKLRSEKKFTFILDEIDDAYSKALLTIRENPNLPAKIQVIYTPLHGTGRDPLMRVFHEANFHNVALVEEQAIEDPSFSTVQYPNPEVQDAFQLAIAQGFKENAELLLATDPDADRLGVAIKTPEGNYQLVTGNEIGALLLHYILEQKQKKDELPKNGVVLKTIVTSELGRAVATKFGMHTVDTLTGFKFIAEKIAIYQETKAFQFLFGYEESYGYLVRDFVRDKDALQAALLIVEMAAFYQTKQLTLYDVLLNLYEEFGYYKETIQSIHFPGKKGEQSMKEIMNQLRSQPFVHLPNVNIIAVEDYAQSIRFEQDGSTSRLTLPSSNVLKFFLTDDSTICIRPSGTEPICKIYFAVKKESEELAKQALQRLQEEFLDVFHTVTTN